MLRINSPCLRWCSGWWCQVGQGGGTLLLIAQVSQDSIDGLLVLNARNGPDRTTEAAANLKRAELLPFFGVSATTR